MIAANIGDEAKNILVGTGSTMNVTETKSVPSTANIESRLFLVTCILFFVLGITLFNSILLLILIQR
jgi:hypothetical protein